MNPTISSCRILIKFYKLIGLVLNSTSSNTQSNSVIVDKVREWTQSHISWTNELKSFLLFNLDNLLKRTTKFK